ncbi:MAG: SpoVR family protein [Myxococcaceae bacterium]
MAELVAGRGWNVSDGETHRRVYDQHIIRDRDVVTVKTRRGFTLTGSNNHRVLLPDGATWKRLDELKPGDAVAVGNGRELWPTQNVAVSWRPAHRVSLDQVAQHVGVSLSTVIRHRAGRNTRQAAAIDNALEVYDTPSNLALPMSLVNRAAITVPQRVDEKLAGFLGYLVGDGHISRVKRNVGLTTGDESQAHAFAQLAHELFGLSASVRLDGNRFRVLLHSETLSDFLVEAIGLTTGPSAREKRIPESVLRSPEPVVRAFLRAYFDCDGYAGKQGVILSTTSGALAETVQLLLLNYGILSRRRPQPKGCWHVHVTGSAAARFAERIGFGLERKQEALERYVADRRWFKVEAWEDEVVSVERGREDVYDISVEETHRYCAAGFVNHNSFWHSNIMTQKALKDSEVIDYADRHSGTTGTRPGALNPYKLGIELFRDIEDRWNKGRFGKEWDECDDLRLRRSWDKKLGTGREKIFEVRKHYNDVTFIDTFLTPEFAIDQKLFVYGFNDKRNSWEILDREFRKVKNKLLTQLTNFGQPVIEVAEGNFENRGELLLTHRHDGQDLKGDYARETLRNLQSLWRRPCNLLTRTEGRGLMVRFDGQNHSEKKVDL